MLRMKTAGPNCHEVHTRDVVVLFSYDTAVAFLDKQTGMVCVDGKFYSKTTSHHRNRFIQEYDEHNQGAIVVTNGVIENCLDRPVFKSVGDKEFQDSPVTGSPFLVNSHK